MTKDTEVEGSRSYLSSVTPLFRGAKAPKTLVLLWLVLPGVRLQIWAWLICEISPHSNRAKQLRVGFELADWNFFWGGGGAVILIITIREWSNSCTVISGNLGLWEN